MAAIGTMTNIKVLIKGLHPGQVTIPITSTAGLTTHTSTKANIPANVNLANNIPGSILLTYPTEFIDAKQFNRLHYIKQTG